MSKLSFNRTPYYDDFDGSRNYMKVLFRPGRPVQTRELNQIQSIVQNQIQLFANHIFKNGSRVSNARASYAPQSYARLEDISPWNSLNVDTRYFTEGTRVVGTTTGITAVVVYVAPKVGEDPNTIYFVYQTIAIDGQTINFLPGETLQVYDKNGIVVYSVKVRCPGCVGSTLEDTIPVVGTGQIFTIDEGVFYFEGMFIESHRQMVLISKYGEIVSCKIGFDFVQRIVTSDEDPSLLDNTLGYPNSSAPGADRYQTTLVLTKRSLTAEDGDDFILLARVDGGGYQFLKGDSEYSDIMDMIAKRTYETNGDFTVVPFKLKIMEEKADSVEDDLGYSVDGNPDYLRIAVTGGIAYVQGYRFKNEGEQFIRCFKARNVQKHRSFIKRFEERTSINLIPLKGYSSYPNNAAESPVIDNTIINIYDGEFDGGMNPTGNLIGSFRVYDVNYVKGVIHSDSNPAVFKYFIYDLKMNGTYQISSAKSFVDSTGTRGFKAIPEDASVTLYNPGKTELLWRLQRDNVKTLRDISESGDPNPSGSIQIFLRKKLIGFLNSSGSVTFTSVSNESFEEFDPTRTVATIIDTDQGAGIARMINITGKTAITSTDFVLNLGNTVDIGTGTPLNTSGKMVSVVHSVMRVNSTESQKQENFVQNESFNPNTAPFNSTKILNLGITDAFEIDYVIERDIGNVNDLGTDITDQFTLNKNFFDSMYGESQLVFTGNIPSNQNIRWSYRIIYIDHNHSSNLGYFNIDSYRDLVSAGLLSYDDNPTYIATNKTEYPLFGSFDFRPDNVGGVISGETVPVIGSTAVFDIEYYLPRVDLLCVNKNGQLYVKYGESAEKPNPPKPDLETMPLYEIHLKPYTYSINDVSVKYIENKRYTMRDIGKLEQRIKMVEYYTVLNLLEKSAADMAIKDSNGLDRFKNGFVADNFQDYQAADLLSSDFRAALDRKRRELRPSFTPRNKEFEINYDESNCKFLGTMAMIDYDSVVVDEQPYATKHISINPYFQFKKKGVMVLLPNMDVWSDTTRLPDLVVNVDTGAEDLKKLAEASGLLGTHWGDWADLSRTVQKAGNDQQAAGGQAGGGTTTTTTTTQQRTGTEVTMGSRTTEYDMGDRVTDVSINPWMRERDITFMATKMKANSRVYAFFDGKPVSQYTRTLKGAPGGDLVTDGNGQIAGVFHCPGGMFHTGDRRFALSSDKDQTGDPDLEFTVSDAIFFSAGLNQTKQQTTMNVTTPVVEVQQVVQKRTVIEEENIPGEPPTPPPINCDDGTVDTSEHHTGEPCWMPDGAGGCWQRCTCCNWCDKCRDPVAQGFKLVRDHFVTGLDLYFHSVDENVSNDISFQIRTMDNGYPTTTILGRVDISPEDIRPFVSEDSTKAFHVEFDYPIFVQGGVTYCFVVAGWSPDTRIWLSKLGQAIADQPTKIVETQPSLESSFRSQNGETWNAEQFEDVKYKLYAARFKSNTMKIQFKNKHESTPLSRDPFEGQQGQSRVRVYVEDHGLNVGDKVSISLYEDSWIEIDIPAESGQMQIGMLIRNTSNTFNGRVIDYKTDQSKKYIRIGKMRGSFASGSAFICDQMDKLLHNNYLITKVGYKGSDMQADGTVRLNTVSGTFKEDSPLDSLYNGFPFSELSRQHTVVAVDSMDTFIIQTTLGTASASGRFGGIGGSIKINEKYEMFNVTGSYLNYGSSEIWSYTGIGHNPPNGPFPSQDYQGMEKKTINLNTDIFLEQPHKIVSEDNALNAGHYISVSGVFKTPNEWVSPVINTDTFSIITVSNRVEWITPDQIDVIPNASGRFSTESDPMNGSENYKYVTKTINLANPASDLVIAFDVYKDINADYDVWVKALAPYENVDIDTKRWMRVLGLNKTYHSADLTDRVEYELTLSELQVEDYTTNTNFTIKDWDVAVEEFKTFKVKLVGRSKNPALPPLFQSLRCIAVT
jgi:hypothetical protein